MEVEFFHNFLNQMLKTKKVHDNKTNICDANNFEMEYKFVELIHKFMCLKKSCFPFIPIFLVLLSIYFLSSYF